jgi:hypothetical protein
MIKTSAEYAITRTEHFSFLAFLPLSVLLLYGLLHPSLLLAGSVPSVTIYEKTTVLCSPESRATLPPFGPIEGHK